MPRKPIRGGVWPRAALLLAALFVTGTADAADSPNTGDLGGGGLMQIPTAEMGADGDVAAFASADTIYRRFGVSGMALPWAEMVLRFTDISDVPYGPTSFSGHQSYLDRGIDARLRLVPQDDFLPDITLGLRDVAGTGLFDAEYLVATGAFDDVAITLGLGWGQLASDNMFSNPLAFIAGRTRSPTAAAGGLRTDYFAGPSMALFGGIAWRTPLPGLDLQLEFNSDDDRQDPFRAVSGIRETSPLDIGMVYRPMPWLVLSAAYERGNTAMLKLALAGNIAHASPVAGPSPPAREAPAHETPGPARSDSDAADPAIIRDLIAHQGWRLLSSEDSGETRYAVIAWIGGTHPTDDAEAIGHAARSIAHLDRPVSRLDLTILRDGKEISLTLNTRTLEIAVAETGRTGDVVEAALGGRVPMPSTGLRLADIDAKLEGTLARDLDGIDFKLDSVELRGPQAIIRFEQNIYRVPARAIGTAARAVLPDLPPEIILVTFGQVEDGVDIADVSLLRHELTAVLAGSASSTELLHHAVFSAGEPPGAAAILNTAAYPSAGYSLRPGLKTDAAGPDGYLLYDLDARAEAAIAVAPGIDVAGTVAASMASDFNRLKLPSDSVLPHVRSDIADYLRDGKYGIARLEADLIRQPVQDLYGRVSCGILEDMFDGIDGELLYRPYAESWAIGIDANHVWQRGFHERFSVRPYQVTTAVLEGYERLPWYGLTVGVKAGRYLAGDAGGTLDLSRTFESGVKIGAFATITTASSHQFGEGRFDKGLYVSIPLDSLIGFASRNTADYTYRAVTRDGGQLIDIDKPLYQLTGGAGPDRVTEDWAEIVR